MKYSVAEIIAIAALVLSGLVWAVRLEGRVDAQTEQIATLKEQQRAAILQVREDLTYIRQRLDLVLTGAAR